MIPCLSEPAHAHSSIEETVLATMVQSRVNRRVRALRLILVDGGIVLRGQAPSFYVKQMAQHAVMEATDLPILANEIEVA